ncbi:SIR2 family protein [Prevotella sp. FD3004]|uniref:SIR2 family protein n=1 Tax=Prevotella sp. FD3004 TaxID=1408309 RepID=UPI00056C2316|nr:SIR2 family protein [Prevotella sp. FD3004]
MNNELSTLERRIFDAILHCLERGETIIAGTMFEFYLPNGLKKLDWPKNTYVEIKFRLIYDSIDKLRNAFEQSNIGKLIVVVISNDDIPKKLYNANYHGVGRNIEFVQYEDFIQELALHTNIKTVPQESIDLFNSSKDEIVIEKAKEAIKHNRVSLFLGAGVSASGGVVTWDSLLEKLCVKKGLPKIKGNVDGVTKGRYIIDGYKKQLDEIPDEFYNDMRAILYSDIHSSELIDSIAYFVHNGNVDSVISYNYDDLVEQKVRRYTPCYPVYDKSRPNDGMGIHIYHVHGFIPKQGPWSPIVLGEKEYHKVYQEAYNWGNVEQLHALCRNVCFFIGLSMRDPNLRRLIDISNDGGEIERVHYAFLRKSENDVPFMEKIMRGFGVNCIWYDKHEDLPRMIYGLIR